MKNNVGALRSQRGISAAQLASAVGISRQAMYAVETGAYVPNTAVSLRLAKELGVTVEDLFQLEDAARENVVSANVLAREVQVRAGDPVQLAYVGDRLMAIPAAPAPFWLCSADGRAGEPSPSRKKLKVELAVEEQGLHNRLVVCGCDPAMGLLTRHLQRASVDLLLCHRNSAAALEALRQKEVHIAGTHLRRRPATDPNLSEITHSFPRDSVAVISFALWQEGLVTAPGNPKQIRSVSDLARRGVRFVNRELGSGCRALLDFQLSHLGIHSKHVTGYDAEVSGHLAAAHAVKQGAADCCIATQAAARAFGLGFEPIEEARYDLVLYREHLGLPAVQKLFDVIAQSRFRKEVAVAAGYETRVTGTQIL